MSLYLPDARFEMPELLVPGRKPTGPVVVDRQHNLARSLQVAYLFKPSSVARDSARGNHGTLYNMQPTFTKDGLYFDGSNDIVKINSPSMNITNIPEAFSFVMKLKLDAADQRDVRFFCYGNTASDLFAFGTADSLPYQRIRTYHTSGCKFDGLWSNRYSTGQPFDGEWVTVGISVQRDGYLSMYVNGVLDSAHYRSAQAGTGDASYQALGAYIRGATPNGGTFANMVVEYFYFYHEELSAAEMLQLSKNPYQFFVPA